MGYHQPKPARSVYTGIVAAGERWCECATRNKRAGTDHIIVVLDLHLSIMVVDGRKGVVVLLTARRSRDNR
jgi:hypothetical protein